MDVGEFFFYGRTGGLAILGLRRWDYLQISRFSFLGFGKFQSLFQ